LQIQLTGFLEKDTPAFCLELWKLCLSAQSNPQGVPKELLEAKKLELIQEKVRRRIHVTCSLADSVQIA
jgi:serine/arginine repetitive matrix protein 1